MLADDQQKYNHVPVGFSQPVLDHKYIAIEESGYHLGSRCPEAGGINDRIIAGKGRVYSLQLRAAGAVLCSESPRGRGRMVSVSSERVCLCLSGCL